ncbi:MAG: hypothetical protein AAF550_10160, partial [Myxococcota bacterium]
MQRNRGQRLLSSFRVVGLLMMLSACTAPDQTPRSQPTPNSIRHINGASADTVEQSAEVRGEASRRSGRRPITRLERRAIRNLLDRASRVRALPFQAPIQVEVHDATAITEHLTSELEEEDLSKTRNLYAALGLLDPDSDIRSILERVLGEQVVGYYDPDQDHLVIRNDVMAALSRGGPTLGRDRGINDSDLGIAGANRVLLHEIVHALQGQHLNLAESHRVERDSDAEHAYRGLVEGDASLAMWADAITEAGGAIDMLPQSAALLDAMLSRETAFSNLGAELEDAPAILKITLVAAYTYGLRFCLELHRQGGWRAIDEAHRNLPSSFEQVLHPEKYLAGELPDEVILGEFPELTDAGFVTLDEDTLGELELAIYFGQGSTGDLALEAAKGWSGDRLRAYYRPDGALAVIWYTTWDNESAAKRAERWARDVAKLDGPTASLERVVARFGRALLITRGVPVPYQHSTRRRFN